MIEHLRYEKFKYLCVYILFILKIQEKLALFMYGVITKALCGVVKQLILLEAFLHNYQEELKIISGSEFIFESFEPMDYQLHRVRLRRGGSSFKSLEWLLHKGATITPKNENDDECLRWSTISALNYNEIRKKEFENIFKKIKYEDKDFSSHQIDWENFEQNNESVALNVLFSSQDSEEITLIYKSEHNYKRENNALLLMINDNEKYHYFAVKSKLELYSSKWLRSKKEAITNGDNCFQNAPNDSLDYQRIKKYPQKISKLKPYINQYNWKGINFPSHKKVWKKFEQNNKEIALNILFVPHNKKEINIAYKSKCNHKRKNQVILLMITDGKKWHYLAVRSLSALFRGITSSNNEDFYCLNCFHSYRTLNKLKKHKKVCNNHEYWHIDMPEEGKNISK